LSYTIFEKQEEL